MAEIDEEKVAELVAQKLASSNREGRDDEFIGKIMEQLAVQLIEHRSPCHDFDSKDVHTLRAIIQSKLRFAKTKGIVKAGLVLFLLKEAFMYLKENLHWGP